MRGRHVAAAIVSLALAGSLVAAWRLRREVARALAPVAADARPLVLVPLPRPIRLPETWAGPEVEAVVFAGGDLVTAGAGGVWHAGRGDLTPGLPSRRATAAALWGGALVVALEAGGLVVERGGAWHELRSGWGTLHGRALVEAPGGELLVGAREGLFRAALGASSLVRLDAHPVRALVVSAGLVLAGGEEGLFRVAPGRTAPVEVPDPWIESVAIADDIAFAVTAAGLARGPREGPLAAVRGGDGIAQGVAHAGRFWAAAAPASPTLRVFGERAASGDEALPSPVRRVMGADGLLFADADDGLYRRDGDGWRLVRPRSGTLPPGSAHVTALARIRGQLVLGLFDGGLVAAGPRGGTLDWQTVPGSAAWGTNALLAAGGELWVASLRGAARFDGRRLLSIEGPGAAFSLAATPDGVAVGYGQGVLLPGSTLLSAFHGLPGNQALALAAADVLYVGTPSGLGAIAGRRVLWRVTAGEGKLPHPWVTALLAEGQELLVGTWGGGLARRREDARSGAPRPSEDGGRWEPFPETEGLEVSPGALVLADGRAWAGTDADGLWRETRDRARFERVAVALPSTRVSALLAEGKTLWVGTDAGLVRLVLGEAGE